MKDHLFNVKAKRKKKNENTKMYCNDKKGRIEEHRCACAGNNAKMSKNINKEGIIIIIIIIIIIMRRRT